MFLSNKIFFQEKTFLKQKSFAAIKMLIFSKLFIWHLPIGWDQRKRSSYTKKPSSNWLEKDWWERERHLCTTFKLRMNSFCRQRAGLEVLIKVTSKSDRWKKMEKSFTKNWFHIVFFSLSWKSSSSWKDFNLIHENVTCKILDGVSDTKSFCHLDGGWSTKILCLLKNSWNPTDDQTLPMIFPWIFLLPNLRFLCLRVLGLQIRWQSALYQGLALNAFFFAQIASSTSWFHQGVLFSLFTPL